MTAKKKNIYDKIVGEGPDRKIALPKQRQDVIKELNDLGMAFVSLLRQKFNLFDMTHEIVPLEACINNSLIDGDSSNVIILQIVISELHSEKIPIVTCSFEPEKTYPCVLSSPFSVCSVACSTLTEVRKTLVSFCDTIGLALMKKIEDFKKGGDALMKNDNGSAAAAPDLSSNS